MITIPLDTHSNIALYEQIYLYIKKEIQTASFPYHFKLPSTRSLAIHLSISRNTIDMAYAQLLSEGYIESVPKSGYYVSEIAVLNILKREEKTPALLNNTIQTSPYLYDFSPFSVDLNHFPYHTWRQLSRNCLADNTELFLLGENQGDYSLRQAITTYIHQSRGVNCVENQVIIGAGVDYLLQLLVGILGNRHTIAMENPSYQRANRIFNGFGIKTVPIALDASGMSIERLDQSCCNIAYVTPSHQYPLGIVMPIKRRVDLLNWANTSKERYIIEDDHDSEFRYKGKPIPSLQGIASNDNVIYIGTFSRAIAPAIRVGYMVLPPSLLAVYQERFSYYASTVSRIDQAILTEFINRGHFERHLNRMRKVYKAKHDTLQHALKALNIPLKISGEHAGMHLVVQLDNGYTERALIEKAKINQIKLYGLKEHFLFIPKDYIPTYLFGYANLTEHQILSGMEHLKKSCLDSM